MLDNANAMEPMDELELYALDLLDDDEQIDLEARIAEDESLQLRVRELRGTLGMLAFDLAPMDPPAGLREQILAQVRAEGSDEPGRPYVVHADHVQEEPTSLFGTSSWVWVAAAMLALAMIAVLALAASAPAGGLQTYPVIAADATDAPVIGDIRLRENAQHAILRIGDLQEPPEGHVYQVWLIAAGHPPKPNVTFVPSTDGRANLVVRGDLADCDLIAITIEPEGGSTAPTSDVVITSDLTRPDSAG